jgi:hypothetical protein
MVDWEKNWRGNGVVAAVLFVSFYDGDSARILIATVVFGFAILCLLWFAAALASVLRDAGKGGWGSAVTAASTAIGAVYFTLVTVHAALAYSIAGSGSDQVTIAWFPVAMLIMAGSFGLWRAQVFSTRPSRRA